MKVCICLIVKISEVKITYGPWFHNNRGGRSEDHRLPTGNSNYVPLTGNLNLLSNPERTSLHCIISGENVSPNKYELFESN